MTTPYLSIAVPTHDMKNADYFLDRLKKSLDIQTFKDFELVITKEGLMAENTNAAIKKSKGQLIKILYMDDFLYNENSLEEIVKNFKKEDQWLVSGCTHTYDGESFFNPHYPTIGESLYQGINTIGSPSVLTIRNKGHLLFDEKMSWLLDIDLYQRYNNKYGAPKILDQVNVAIGLGDHQVTNIMTNEEKLKEADYLFTK